jgi:DNA (cytosine-5)-methyltransferase 1
MELLNWKLADLAPPDASAPTVFSCFHCGGGSTMGYKRAGFRVLGGVEIDPAMMTMYRDNHHPALSYLMGVQDFAVLPDDKIDPRLFSLDVLDGSPPCSSFSTSGAREKKWGTKSKFREGQADQVLDDLFFHFIAAAERLRPKVVIAENVKGLIVGKAKGYVKLIFQRFEQAGYDVQLFLLNSSAMGVPQRRERTFFVARRRDLGLPKLSLSFSEKPITIGEALDGADQSGARRLTDETRALWARCALGDNLGTVHPRGSRFACYKQDPSRPANTITGSSIHEIMHWSEPRYLSADEIRRLQTFPSDYKFGKNEPHYVCGMSVPPFMMERVARELRRQWFGALEG